MAENAGDIESKVKLNLSDVRKGLQTLDTLVKLGGSSIAKDARVRSTEIGATVSKLMDNITKLTTKSNARVAEFGKELTKLRAIFIKLAKADDTRTRYKTTLKLLDSMILTTEKYEKTSKKQAETKKKKLKDTAIAAKAAAKVEVQAQRDIVKAEKDAAYAAKNTLWARSKAFATGTLMARAFQAILRGIRNTIRALISVTVNYEQSMANTQSVMQATTKDLRALDTAARHAGETTRFTATQAADALYFMASAGLTANESIETLDGTLSMAQATGKSLRDTAEIMTITLAQFNLKASESSRVANALTAGITSSQATMDKYKTSLYQVGPVASGMGRSLEEVIGVLDIMYDSGMQASRSGRAMRNVLAELANEGSATSKKLTKMGIDFKDIDVTTNTLVESFGTLNEANLSSGQIMKAFGKVIGPQMQVIIRSSREELTKYTEEVKNTNKAFLAAHIQNDTTQGDWFRLKSALEAFGITLGKMVTPLMRGFLQLATSVTRGLNKFIKTMNGSRSVANDMADAIGIVNTATDEYARLTTLLNDKTLILTNSERKLYEQRLTQTSYEVIKSLQEMSKAYEENIQNERELNVIQAYTGAVRDKMLYWKQLSDLVATVKDQEATGGGPASKVQTDELDTLVSKIRDADKVLRGVGYNVEQLALGGSRAQKRQLSDAKESLDFLTTFTKTYGRAVPDTFAKFGKDSSRIIKYLGEQVGDALMGVAEKANEAENAYLTAKDTRNNAIISAGRLYALEAIQDKQLIGMNENLVASIRAEAEVYDANRETVNESTVTTYEAISALQTQLDLTAVTTKAISSFSTSMLSSAQSAGKNATDIGVLNTTYDSLVKSLGDVQTSTNEAAQEQLDANILMIDEAENVGAVSKAMLVMIATQHKEAEVKRIALETTQELIVLEKERMKTIGIVTSTQSEALKKTEAEQTKELAVASAWSAKLVDAELNVQSAMVDTAYKSARTAEDFKTAYENRLVSVRAYSAQAVLDFNRDSEVAVNAEKLASLETLEIKKQEHKDSLALQADFFAAKNAQSSTDLLKGQSENKAIATQATADEELDYQTQQKKFAGNITELANIEKRHTAATKAIAKENSRANIETIYAYHKSLVDARVENGEKVKAIDAGYTEQTETEKKRLSDFLVLLDTKTTTERVQLLAYYGLQEVAADEERTKLYDAEVKRQDDLREKWTARAAINEEYIKLLDTQIEAVREARIEQLRAMGDVNGAIALQGEIFTAAEKVKQAEAKATYDAEIVELDKNNAEGIFKGKEYADELARINTEYESSKTSIATYYSGERDTIAEEFADSERIRVRGLYGEWVALQAIVEGYTDTLSKQKTDKKVVQIDEFKAVGKFKEARDLQRQIDKESTVASQEELRARIATEYNLNYEAYQDGTKSYTEYVKRNKDLKKASTSANLALLEAAHATELLTEEEFLKAKKDFYVAYGNDIANLAISIVDFTSTMITAMYDAQLAGMELIQDRYLATIQFDYEAELELNKVKEDTAVESAQKALARVKSDSEDALAVARASADEATVIKAEEDAATAVLEAENAVKKAVIDEKYAAKKLKAEQDFAWEVAQIQYAAANTAWGLNLASSISSGILAIINAAKLGWPLNIVPVTLTTAAIGTQLFAQKAAKPVAPVQADYYGTGGIIAGSPEGTSIVAGEHNRIETILNPEQMARVLMQIANGNGSTGKSEAVQLTLILQDSANREQAKYTVECLNNSIYLLDPNKALKKVAQ